jgi:hypothetical protein
MFYLFCCDKHVPWHQSSDAVENKNQVHQVIPATKIIFASELQLFRKSLQWISNQGNLELNNVAMLCNPRCTLTLVGLTQNGTKFTNFFID